MEIKDIKTTIIRYELKRPEKPERRDVYEISETIIQVFTDEDIVGLGSTIGDPVVPILIEKHLKPLIIGEDPFNIEKIWRKLFHSLPSYGQRGRNIEAISGIEIALWDIMGKALHAPVYKLLGGCYREKVRVYASKLFSVKPDDIVKEALEVAEKGFTAAKIQLGLSLMEDLERIKAVRKEVSDLELMADANGCYTFHLARKAAREFEKYDLSWLEEPIDPTLNCLDNMSRLVALSLIPIAAGERFKTKYEANDFLQKKAVDIIQHSCMIGGILEAKKACAIAEALDIPWAPQAFGGIRGVAILHLAVSTPNFMIMEVSKDYPSELETEIFVKPMEIKKGYVEIPKGYGLGIELNEAALVKHSIEVKDWNVRPHSSAEAMPRWFSPYQQFEYY